MIDSASLRARWQKRTDADRSRLGQSFLLGEPPTWEIAASTVPVKLEESTKLTKELFTAVDEMRPFLVVAGPAGSGKTTATMMALLQLAETNRLVQVIDVSPDVASVTDAIQAALEIYKGKQIVAFVSDLFPYGGNIRKDVSNLSGKPAQIVCVSRLSEWQSNYARYLNDVATLIEFRRFTKGDEPHIVDTLNRYISNPDFARLSQDDKLQRLRASKHQLLIALREATSSMLFNDIIEEEYRRLDDDSQRLFLIAAVATLARTGISLQFAFSAYRKTRISSGFDVAHTNLSGIVSDNRNDRLIVRHSVYARHVLEEVSPFREVSNAIIATLDQYTAYRTPVLASVSRLDAALFKFLLNHDFIYQIAKAHDIPEDGLKVYENFEVKLQLDGHYWLQYGLYLDKSGILPEARDKLEKSIKAYPENLFAQHALARLKLRLAAQSDDYDYTTKQLIQEAVDELNSQDARDSVTTDIYPLATLAHFHINALLLQGDRDTAAKYAKEYRDRLIQLSRKEPGAPLQSTIDNITRFLAAGSWRSTAPSLQHRKVRRR